MVETNEDATLTARQLQIVVDAARTLAPEKRDTFLRRILAVLNLRGRFTDDDVADAAQRALTGLAHQPAA